MLLCLAHFPSSVQAIPAITCHCFTERNYQPERPVAADKYFLATAQNSFFAAVFGVDKKTIVFKKQQGASSDDLWVAYWIASRTGMDADRLLQARGNYGSWSGALDSLKVAGQNLGTSFIRTLEAKSDSSRLAEMVVDGFIVRHSLSSAADLAALRQVGADNQELILSTYIASRSKQPARSVYQSVKKGSVSWGELLNRVGVNANNLHKEITAVLHK